jgi:hypothetical protein
MGPWTDPKSARRRSAAAFQSGWPDTLRLLGDEVEKIAGADAGFVIEIDVAEGDIRVDGSLRARAEVGFPGARVSFAGPDGPLTFATDAYERSWNQRGGLASWQANVRAIALTLGALRDINRWGVAKGGQQYTGWKQLPAADGSTFPSAEAAWRWMLDKAIELKVRAPVGEPQPRDIYRELTRKMHPDSGGGQADWDRLSSARLLLQETRMM